MTDGRTHLGVGGGIVADSDPGAEWAETELKARGSSPPSGTARRTGGVPPRRVDSVSGVTTPSVWVDGALIPAGAPAISAFDHGLLVGDGVFETLRVYGGPAVRVDTTHRPARLLGRAPGADRAPT